LNKVAFFEEDIPQGAKQAAEKGRIESEIEARIPQGLKPDDDLIGFGGTTEVVPFQNFDVIMGSISTRAGRFG